MPRTAIAILTLATLLTGCADPTVVAVKTPLAQPPSACRAEAKAVRPLPDRELSGTEMAQHYARLKAQYLRETGKARLCRKYVARIAKG